MDLEIKQRLKRIVAYWVVIVLGAILYVYGFGREGRAPTSATILFATVCGPLFWQSLDEVKKIRERKIEIKRERREGKRGLAGSRLVRY